MNSTHAVVGVSAATAVDQIQVLLTGFHGLDAAHAGALAWLIVMVGGAIVGGVNQWLTSKGVKNVESK